MIHGAAAQTEPPGPAPGIFDPKHQSRRYLSVGNWFKSGARNHLPANRSLGFWFEILI